MIGKLIERPIAVTMSIIAVIVLGSRLMATLPRTITAMIDIVTAIGLSISLPIIILSLFYLYF